MPHKNNYFYPEYTRQRSLVGAVSTEQMESSTQEAFNRAESSAAGIIFTSLECGPPKPVLEFSEVLVKPHWEVCRIAVCKCAA